MWTASPSPGVGPLPGNQKLSCGGIAFLVTQKRPLSQQAWGHVLLKHNRLTGYTWAWRKRGLANHRPCSGNTGSRHLVVSYYDIWFTWDSLSSEYCGFHRCLACENAEVSDLFVLRSTCIYGDHETESRTPWKPKRTCMSSATDCRGAFQSGPSWAWPSRVWKRRRCDLGQSWCDRQAHVNGRGAERAAWQGRRADPPVGLISALPLRTPPPTRSQQQTPAVTGVCLTLRQVCWAGSRSRASQHPCLSTDWHPCRLSPSWAWIWVGGSPRSRPGVQRPRGHARKCTGVITASQAFPVTYMLSWSRPCSQTQHLRQDLDQIAPQAQTRPNGTNLLEPQMEPNSKLLCLKLLVAENHSFKNTRKRASARHYDRKDAWNLFQYENAMAFLLSFLKLLNLLLTR